MNYVLGGLLGLLAIVALSPPSAINMMRDRINAFEDRMSSYTPDSPYSNRAMERSIAVEREELNNRIHAFNVWKERKVCGVEADEYREFLRETGRTAPVVGCN